MHRELHTLLFATFCIALSACASQPLPRVEIPLDSRISLTIARASQRLRIQVLETAHCGALDTSCPQGKPVERVAVAVQTSQGNHELGLTGENGWLELPLSELDPLFPIEMTSKAQLASLIVSGQGVAEIPVGSIVHRHEIVAATIGEAETVLALSQAELEGDWWYYSQELLGRMLELQLRGEANEELVKLAARLHTRLANSNQATWFGARWWNRVKDVLDDIFASGDDADVPDGLRDRARGNGDPRASEDLEQSLEWLPQACNVTVKGTAIAAQIAIGQPALAVALIGAVIGSEIQNWMVKACCNLGSETLSGGPTPACTAL